MVDSIITRLANNLTASTANPFQELVIIATFAGSPQPEPSQGWGNTSSPSQGLHAQPWKLQWGILQECEKGKELQVRN